MNILTFSLWGMGTVYVCFIIIFIVLFTAPEP
jgi:hypothetical protein